MTTHNAPPVVYPIVRSRLQAWVLLAVWGAGVLAVLGWFQSNPVVDWRVLLAVSAVLVAGVVAFAGWKNAARGQLAWDGQMWRWESPGYQTGVAEQQLRVIADFQHLLLLRLENQAHARLWLWLERRACPERWLDFRRAVYSPHRWHAVARQRHDPAARSGSGSMPDVKHLKP